MRTEADLKWQELIQVADSVARDKQIDRELVVQAIEEAIQRAASSKYGGAYDVRVSIDRKTGYARIVRVKTVVESDADYFTEIVLSEAVKIKEDAAVGDTIEEVFPDVEFGRVAAQTARQVIINKVREAERLKQYEEFKDRVLEVVNGVVRRIEYGNVIVDIGRGEALLRRDHIIPRETFHVGERVRAIIREVKYDPKGYQVILSRTDPKFLLKLFVQEVPEIYEGVVEIMAVSRVPGERAKMAVMSRDRTLDPVGSCVGYRGVRVQAVVSELQGEKIDIIPWSEDPVNFIVSALQPAEVVKVVMDEEDQRIEVVVSENQLSLAIGRRGQNVRLASQLTGWKIDVMSENEESDKRRKEFLERTEKFMENLKIDETLAQILASEGFSDVEDIAFIDQEELESIEGVSSEVARYLQDQARSYMDKVDSDMNASLGIQDDLLNFEKLTHPMVVSLAKQGILSLKDFAELADWELAGGSIVDKDGREQKDEGMLEAFGVTQEDAREAIMMAREALGYVAADHCVSDEVKE